MTKQNHTQLPWEVDAYRNIVTVKRCEIETSNAEEVICEPMSAENAAFIVKAVNCHYELLEALEMVRDADEDCKKDGLPRWCTDIARAKIDATISKAEQ